MPFHYGDWDDPERHGAANELTLSGWDPVSKQPFFKYAAVNVRRAIVDDEPTVGPPDIEQDAGPGAPLSEDPPDTDSGRARDVDRDHPKPVMPGGIR